MGTETVLENRPLSPAEEAIVRWLLRNGSGVGDLSHLEATVGELRVVGRCSCGCPSVDFTIGGQAPGAAPIANGHGTTADGLEVGVMLWERDGVLSGLEFYDLTEPVRALPLADTLSAWPPE
jgi:hypothetical protein